MMNGVTGVNVNTQKYQMAFKAKGNKKAASEVVDKINEAVIDFLNKDRPLAEKKEILIRKSLQYLKDFKIEDLFVGKKIKPEKATIEHLNPSSAKFYEAEYLEYKQYIDRAVANGMLDAEHAGVLLRNKAIALTERKVAGMSAWEMLKEIAASMFKKS